MIITTKIMNEIRKQNTEKIKNGKMKITPQLYSENRKREKS